MKVPVLSLVILFATQTAGAQTAQEARRHYELGETAYAGGRYAESLQHFTACLQADAAYYDAYPWRASVKERLGDWPGAVSDYSIYLEIFPDHSDVLFSRGVARYRAEQYRQATDDLTRLLQLPAGPQETRAIYYRQSAFGDGTDRIMTTGGAIKDQVYNYLGLAALRMEQYRAALAYFDSALALNAADPDYYVHRGLVKQESGDPKGAEADYRHALTLDEDHPLAFHNLGVLLKESGGKGAEEQFNRAIERYPQLPYSYLERAYYRMTNGNLAGALGDYNKAIELDNDDPDSWVNRGLVKEKLNDLPGAFRDFTQAIELRHSFEKAWFCRGNILSKMNKLQEAVEDYTVAITYFPDYALAYHNRAVAEHRLGQPGKACEDVKRAEAAGMNVSARFKATVCGSRVN